MMRLCAGDAAKAVQGMLCGAPEATPIEGVAIDNRKVEKGFLFVPIRGARFDGHDFIPAAFAAGAALCLSERDVPFAHIRVADSLAAFQSLAGYYKSRFPIHTVGITGSVGKTTTKELLSSALSEAFSVLKSPGNLNNQTGVPQALFQIEPHHQVAVIEMGTNHFGEIASLARMVQPDFCVFTNIGDAHIEHLGSREGILRAKCEMLESMAPGGKVFVNGDDALLSRLRQERGDCISFGFGPENDFYATDMVENGLLGTEFTACFGEIRLRIRVPAPGRHMVSNALCALAVGTTLGMDGSAIARGIAQYSPLPGRMCVQHGRDVTVLNDVYNANPSSVRAALDVLAEAKGRRLCILGDMLELGEEAARYHRETGQYAAEKGIDQVICVGALSRETLAGAGERGIYFETQEALLAKLGGLIQPGDTVLVKASRGMALEKTVEALLQSF